MASNSPAARRDAKPLSPNRDRALVDDEAYPWVPEDAYPDGPRMCPCGHHEGWHSHAGGCWHARECGCTGLPVECYTPIPGKTWKGVTG